MALYSAINRVGFIMNLIKKVNIYGIEKRKRKTSTLSREVPSNVSPQNIVAELRKEFREVKHVTITSHKFTESGDIIMFNIFPESTEVIYRGRL